MAPYVMLGILLMERKFSLRNGRFLSQPGLQVTQKSLLDK